MLFCCYIKVKVSQDLYQELGLCPLMELVRSDSKGSIKFVPLSSKDDFGGYESPLKTSSLFGNLTNTEKVTGDIVSKVLPCESASNVAIFPSASINEERIVKRFKSSHQKSVNSDPSELTEKTSIPREDKVRCTPDKLCADENNASVDENESESFTFIERPDIEKGCRPSKKNLQSRVQNYSNQGEFRNELTLTKENKILTSTLKVNPIVSFPFVPKPTGYVLFPHRPVNLMPSTVQAVNTDPSESAEQNVISKKDELKQADDKCCDNTSRNDPCEGGNKSEIPCVNRTVLNPHLLSDRIVPVTLMCEDAINNQLICNKGSTLLVPSALQVNSIVKLPSLTGSSKFLIFSRHPMPDGVHKSINSETSIIPEQVTHNNEELKCDTNDKMCGNSPQNYQYEKERKSKSSNTGDNVDLNASVSSENEAECRVENDSSQDMFGTQLTSNKGSVTLTPEDKPLNSFTPPSNPTKYSCFPSKSTNTDVPLIEPDPSGRKMSSVTLSASQFDGVKIITSSPLAKQFKSFKLSGVETEVSASDLPLENNLVLKGSSAPGKSLVKCQLLPKARNWLSRKPAVPTITFSKLDVPKMSARVAEVSSPLADSSSTVEYEISPFRKKEGQTTPFISISNKDGTKTRLQCTKCSSLYSSQKTFHNHLSRCCKPKLKKPSQSSKQFPMKCKLCPRMIFCQPTLYRHLRKFHGDVYYNMKRISAESRSTVLSASLENNDVASKEDDKYTLFKRSESCNTLFYVKKKESAKSD